MHYRRTDREKERGTERQTARQINRLTDRPPHQWLEERTGLSFWAMWYRALMAFMLNRGGFLSATQNTHTGISSLSSMQLDSPQLALLSLCR